DYYCGSYSTGSTFLF
nr:immunoglobulin light chain junction region [Macaca mulatta]